MKEKSKVIKSNKLEITHLEIATDLNSSRVVISSLLKQLEKEQILVLGRNTITLIDENLMT